MQESIHILFFSHYFFPQWRRPYRPLFALISKEFFPRTLFIFFLIIVYVFYTLFIHFFSQLHNKPIYFNFHFLTLLTSKFGKCFEFVLAGLSTLFFINF